MGVQPLVFGFPSVFIIAVWSELTESPLTTPNQINVSFEEHIGIQLNFTVSDFKEKRHPFPGAHH